MSHKTLAGAVQSKFWGHTQCIFVGPFSETHFLKISKGGFCSEHEHKNKWNRFFLISGKLKVTIYRPDGYDETILEAGQFTDVPPSNFHKFEALEDCECLEIYWVDNLEVGDINRRSVGGKKGYSDDLFRHCGIYFDPLSHEQTK
ncbi:hypothetical protein DRO61_11170 [Candidatus Bathyarchaeota archaeon]|nr:MAG: hypothetical protein DRO61_11170 [Candidatus Bathyarchaeota archaeon]